MTVVGVLGSPRRAEVDGRGGVTLGRGDGVGGGPGGGLDGGRRVRVEWLVGADDRWHTASSEVAVRQRRVAPAPAVETAMRIPSGDAVQRVYAVGGQGDLVVADFENASPAPFVLALVVRGRGSLHVSGDDGVISIDGVPTIVGPRAPARFAAGAVGAATAATVGGEASLATQRIDVRAPEVVLLWPVTHRTVLRLALVMQGSADHAGRGTPSLAALPALPSIGDVVAGWRAQLERGMRVRLPDDALQSEVDAARADALLAAAAVVRPDDALLVDLEDWGFDAEAAAAWSRAGWRARRRARKRGAVGRGGDGVLAAVRDMLVREHGNVLEAIPALPPAWRGASLDVREAPTRLGRLSYSVRWHGHHPALLWEISEPVGDVTLRAPALEPGWSTAALTGETLLRVPSRA